MFSVLFLNAAKYRLNSDGYIGYNGLDLSTTGAAGTVEVYIQGAWLHPCIPSLSQANAVCQHFGMTSALDLSIGFSASPTAIPATVFQLDCSSDSVDCIPNTQYWFANDSTCSGISNVSVTCQSKE